MTLSSNAELPTMHGPSDSSQALSPLTITGALEDTSLEDVSASGDGGHERRVAFHPIPTAALLVAFSVIGVLVRVGLLEMHDYDGAPVISIIYPQLMGCIIIGSVNVWRTSISGWYHPLYVGLATGLCGSITTFSSWSLDTFLALTTTSGVRTAWNGDNILAGLAITIVVLSVSCSGVSFGAQIVSWGSPPPAHPATVLVLEHRPWLHRGFGKRDWVAVAVGGGVWAGAVVLAVTVTEWKHVLVAAAVGPLGTILRWQLSILNVRYPTFPLGTFIANMLATLLIGVSYRLSDRSTPNPRGTLCTLLYALSMGFCGCLSTVSTFVVELNTLPTCAAYIYATVSIVAGVVGLLIVVGPRVGESGGGGCGF
ncbi:CrcB-like protein-domain-containing protein [Powellomyces hirtus]|nr:CrcB-like protein-domain-containing protein [Powellomyces hirtus]